MRTFTFYLIRHARAVNEATVVGSTDIPLVKAGEDTASGYAEAFKSLGVEAVFTSPLRRASNTARLLFPDSTPIVIDGLKEYDFGELEGKKFSELMPEVDLRLLTEMTATANGAEKKKEYLDRLFGAFLTVVDSCMKSSVYSAAIVSHGYNIMTLMAAFAYPKLSSMFDYRVGNCCGYVLKTDAATWMRDRAMEIDGEIKDGRIIDFER